MISHFTVLTAAAMMATSVLAQDSYSVEDFAEVRSFETASFDPYTVRTLGDLTRFEVTIRSTNPDQRPPGAAARRDVRYAARCAAGEIALAAVALVDENGRVLKMMTVPPGGSDYIKPAADSRQAEWMKRACRS